jgi:uncharacterized protein (DUF736 family)
MKLAAWKRVQENTGSSYLSITVSEKQSEDSYRNDRQEVSTSNNIGDEIPF